jgi:hypothetical protein
MIDNPSKRFKRLEGLISKYIVKSKQRARRSMNILGLRKNRRPVAGQKLYF